MEDKYKAAMMSSAQLDNEKQSLVYQVELLKDQLEEQAETHTELQREVKDKNRVGLLCLFYVRGEGGQNIERDSIFSIALSKQVQKSFKCCPNGEKLKCDGIFSIAFSKQVQKSFKCCLQCCVTTVTRFLCRNIHGLPPKIKQVFFKQESGSDSCFV